MALLDFRNIPFELSLKLTDDEIIAIETGTYSSDYESFANAKVDAKASLLNISFADALQMSDAEIIALETGALPKDLPLPPQDLVVPIVSMVDPSFSLKDHVPVLPIVKDLPFQDPFPRKGPEPFVPIVKNPLSHRKKDPTPLPPVIPPQVPYLDEPDVVDEDLSSLDELEFYTARLRQIRFIRKLETEDSRPSYQILVDASVKMFNQQYNTNGETVFDFRWKEAKKVVSSLVPKVTRCDLKGATVVFFSDNKRSTSHSGICTSEQAAALFSAKENQFRGGRNLNSLLAGLFSAQSELSPSSILILLSGAPSESEEALQLMLEASRSSTKVRLSFVQVGDDPAAKEWLESLSKKTELKQIVDVTTLASMRNTWLSEKVDFLFEYTTGY